MGDERWAMHTVVTTRTVVPYMDGAFVKSNVMNICYMDLYIALLDFFKKKKFHQKYSLNKNPLNLYIILHLSFGS